MMALNTALVLLTVVLGLLPFVFTLRMQRYPDGVREGANAPAPLRPVFLVLPCKGIDPGFRDNIDAWFMQDCPDLHLVFAVATADDPAYAELRQLLGRHERAGARHGATIVVAGIDDRRAQKLTNQLAAVRSVDAGAGVLVFADSDIRPDPGFVSRLIAPLGERGVGATTGFRWYLPPQPTLGAMLRSTWNAGALPFLCDPAHNFAWGGAMAISGEVFQRAAVDKAWDRAVSDDFPFTLAVRRLGLELRFVTSCIAISHEGSTLRETLEFTNRQSIISRVYFPFLWWSAALVHSFANLLPLYGFGCAATYALGGDPVWLVGAGCLVLVPLSLANAALLLGNVKRLLPGIAGDLERLRWRYVLCAPVASLLSLVNTLYSATTRRITWRGISYELRSPTDTVVLKHTG